MLYHMLYVDLGVFSRSNGALKFCLALSNTRMGLCIPEAWIGHRKVFAETPSFIKNECANMYNLPAESQARFVPPNHISIRQLLAFAPIMPSQSKTSAGLHSSVFYSDLIPTSPVNLDDLTKLPFPPADVLPAILETKDQAWLEGKKSVIYSHLLSGSYPDNRYPLWVVTFWAAMQSLQDNVLQHWLAAELHLLKLAWQSKRSERHQLVEDAQAVLGTLA
jgi:hypothetical protein